jgi:hypothetical protein
MAQSPAMSRCTSSSASRAAAYWLLQAATAAAPSSTRIVASACSSTSPESSISTGKAGLEFQYRSKEFDASRTTGPNSAKSRSTKLTVSLAPKYSSARLRPPTIAIRLSAIQVLLCMRRLRRSRSSSPPNKVPDPGAGARGLKMRTAMFRWTANAANMRKFLRASRPSISSRTVTPRSAASRTR